MSATLGLRLETEPLERAVAQVAVVSFFETDRPLRGAAGRADWRLCGMLSRLIAAGRLRGAEGEACLVPALGALKAESLLALGLGSPEGFGPDDVARATEAALGRLLDLGVGRAALALPGEGRGAVPVRPASEAAVHGAVTGLARRAASLQLSLLVPAAEIPRALRGLEAVGPWVRRCGVTLRVAEPSAAVGVVQRADPLPLRNSPVRGAP